MSHGNVVCTLWGCLQKKFCKPNGIGPYQVETTVIVRSPKLSKSNKAVKKLAFNGLWKMKETDGTLKAQDSRPHKKTINFAFIFLKIVFESWKSHPEAVLCRHAYFSKRQEAKHVDLFMQRMHNTVIHGLLYGEPYR